MADSNGPVLQATIYSIANKLALAIRRTVNAEQTKIIDIGTGAGILIHNVFGKTIGIMRDMLADIFFLGGYNIKLLVIFGLGLAGVNVINSKRELSSDLIVRPRKNIQVKVDRRVQQMVDEVCIASGRRAPSEIAAENRLKRFSELNKQGGEYKDLQSLIKAAEGLNGAQKPRDEMTKPPRSPEKLDI